MNLETNLIVTLAAIVKMLSYCYPVLIVAILMMIAEKHIKPDLSS